MCINIIIIYPPRNHASGRGKHLHKAGHHARSQGCRAREDVVMRDLALQAIGAETDCKPSTGSDTYTHKEKKMSRQGEISTSLEDIQRAKEG